MEEIINKVKDSGLLHLDLEKFKPSQKVVQIDIADQLWNGFVLKEKDFRSWIKDNNWDELQGCYVHIVCTADAIVPTWAYMLLASVLEGKAETWVVGTKEDLLKKVIAKKINRLDDETYRDGRVIIKGCSDHPYPDFAMAMLVEKLQPLVKSIMYGEPCSTVPIFKRK
jgi:hypothetical protein